MSERKEEGIVQPVAWSNEVIVACLNIIYRDIQIINKRLENIENANRIS